MDPARYVHVAPILRVLREEENAYHVWLLQSTGMNYQGVKTADQLLALIARISNGRLARCEPYTPEAMTPTRPRPLTLDLDIEI